MPLTKTELALDQIADCGQALYEQRLRDQVEAAHFGQYLVIDTASGDSEIGPEHLATAKRLHARLPDASLYGIKIGYPVTLTARNEEGDEQ